MRLRFDLCIVAAATLAALGCGSPDGAAVAIAAAEAEDQSEVVEVDELDSAACTGIQVLVGPGVEWKKSNGALLFKTSNSKTTLERQWKDSAHTACIVKVTKNFDWQSYGYRGTNPISYMSLQHKNNVGWYEQVKLTGWDHYVATCSQQKGYYSDERFTTVNLYPLSTRSITKHAATTLYKCP